jgi:hypothetical protein
VPELMRQYYCAALGRFRPKGVSPAYSHIFLIGL